MSITTSKNVTKRICFVLTLALAAVVAAGCAAREEANPNSHSKAAETSAFSDANASDSFPVTLSVNGEDITIEKKPERIAALSLDAAEAVLELVEPERVAVVPKSIRNRSLAYRHLEGEKVKNTITGATSLDPEQVLSYNADLLIVTNLHDQEKDAGDILRNSGLPVITLEAWSSLEAVMHNMQLIGKAVGEEAKAETLVSEMKQKSEKIVATVEGSDPPSVLVVSPLGPGTGPYLLGVSNISYDLVRLAGGTHAAEQLGLKRTTKASIEQIMKVDPEYILLVEWQEGNDEDLREVTETPGWSSLQAVQHDRVKRMPARELLNPNRYSVDSLKEIAKWLHPERF